MVVTLCPDCGHICDSHAMCLKYQDFNLIVENAKKIAELKKYIKISAPHYKGNKQKWFSQDFRKNFEEVQFSQNTEYFYRFMTLTFDPRKFSFDELTSPEKLLNYVFNSIYDLKNLFEKNPIIVIEYHKSGIPHIHMNYSVRGPFEHSCLMLRLKYYLAKDLRNRHAVNDRIFNEGGIKYLQKSNTTYFRFKQQMEGETCGLEPLIKQKNIVEL